MMRPWHDRKAFTLLEFLVAIAVIAILLGTLIPWSFSVREAERRTRCMDNLSKLGRALSAYGSDHRNELPRVIYDEKTMPWSYSAFTGPDAANPFSPSMGVSANDVTASLWLLIRGNYMPSQYSPPSSVFICPSSGDSPDMIRDALGAPVSVRQRSNFRSSRNLSYSYASPFSNAAGYGLKSDFIVKDFVLLADKNPGTVNARQDATGPSADAPPLTLKAANSPNHGGAGQTVLFGDMHAEFRTTPYCGVDQDNIYTAVAPSPIITGEPPRPKSKGFIGRSVGPAYSTDSYLVPTASDN